MSFLSEIIVKKDSTFSEILEKQNGSKEKNIPTGIALVTDDRGCLIGTVSEGDIRRGILDISSLEGIAEEIMENDPIVFHESTSFHSILENLPKELSQRGRKSKKYLGRIILVDDAQHPVRVLDYETLWEQRVALHRNIVVIGLGYVGLTLAVTLAEKGYQVFGVDKDRNRIKSLENGNSYVHEIGLPSLLKKHIGKNFKVSDEIEPHGDVFIVSVGTPVSKDDHKPNLAAIRASASEIAEQIKPGALIVLRSTVPIGTSRDIVAKIIEEKTDLKAGRDFHLAFAPERTVEGNALKELLELPQIIGGINKDSVEACAALFKDLNSNIVRVDSLEAAEMCKLINNCFRDLIFSFSNEITQLASYYNLDIHKIVHAANTGYPRDPVPLPSPGVGGPCLTKDPYILSHTFHEKLGKQSLSFLGRLINESMIEFITSQLIKALSSQEKNLNNSRVLICGLAFKGAPETSDFRNSPSIDFYEHIKEKVDVVGAHDPVVKKKELDEFDITFEEDFYSAISNYDMILFMNNHSFYRKLNLFKVNSLLKEDTILFDGWNLFMDSIFNENEKIIYLSLSSIN